MAHRLGISIALAALAALVPSQGADARAAAPKGSILYVKAGKLWVTSPDGKVKRRIPHTGSFENPSQADDGTVVAQRGTRLYRLTRKGRQLGPPITTAFRTNPVVPAFNGPFWPQVSPDGKRIAYTYSFTASHLDYSCLCMVVRPSFHVTYTWANRFTDSPQTLFGNPAMYSKPSWIDNRSVLMTTESLYDFGGNVLDTVAIDTVGGSGNASYQRWFAECVAGCDSVFTLSMYTLDDGEMTRQRDRLAFVAGELDQKEVGSRLLLYGLQAAAPAIPGSPCHVTGPAGKFSSPTWSPDGRSLAWADDRGVWVGRVSSLERETCGLTRRLIAPGGSAPDWGPAKAG